MLAALWSAPWPVLGAATAVDADGIVAPQAVLSANEAALLHHVNDYRAGQGLTRWLADVQLQALARGASEQMAARRQAGHDGFRTRFVRSGRRLCVEVIAQGRMAPEIAVSLWRRSPEHHRNLVEPRARWAGLSSVDGYTTLLACDAPAI